MIVSLSYLLNLKKHGNAFFFRTWKNRGIFMDFIIRETFFSLIICSHIVNEQSEICV